MNLFTKQKQSHRLREQTYGYGYEGQGEGWGKGIVREFGMYTLLYLKWITNRDLLYSTGNSVQYYLAAQVAGELGGEWIHVYVWLSALCCAPETITTLLIAYTPI